MTFKNKQERLEYMRKKYGPVEVARCDAVIIPTDEDVADEVERLDTFAEHQRATHRDKILTDE
jgi:hypothetical protein